MTSELTGRIVGVPSEVWHEEVLAPQFAYEAEHLLRHYVAIEKVLLLEYRRMGLVDAAGAVAVAERLDLLSAQAVRADPQQNMSDISFAIERHAATGPVAPFPAWHVDRSRNDLQVCAQLLHAREQVVDVAADLLEFAGAAAELARRYPDVPMPGYTHAQAAQIVTPGFYFAAVSAETLAAVRRLLRVYDEIDASPLGSGTMAGQELAWDRERMAALLGFARAQPHALVAVASRSWALAIAMELSNYAITLSRFSTDLMTWAAADTTSWNCRTNCRGSPRPCRRSATSRSSNGSAAGARMSPGWPSTWRTASGTPATPTPSRSPRRPGRNSAPRSPHCAQHYAWEPQLCGASGSCRSMREVCELEYLGGFTLANQLTLRHRIPWREAQVIAGRYVKQAMEKGLGPSEPDGGLLAAIAVDAGHRLPDAAALLAETLGVDQGLRAKQSQGSTHPDAVTAMLTAQAEDAAGLAEQWEARRRTGPEAADRTDSLLHTPEP
ncbi:argininosuccinate lyase [Streptacidiphilus sp. 4-A2]|nr:argininosuccinate lyase [Streptacidiphilus sp. 4-A2]